MGHSTQYIANGFERGAGSNRENGFVSICPKNTSLERHCHINCTFYMPPSEARLLAQDILDAACIAEGIVPAGYRVEFSELVKPEPEPVAPPATDETKA
jgi:hypothetical protein